MAGDRLDSWKEIAAYLNRGVRTVRRWEREEGLPVHRHVHRTLGSVYASRSEIDAWRQTRGTDTGTGAQPTPSSALTAASGKLKSIAVLPFTNLSTDPENAYGGSSSAPSITCTRTSATSARVRKRGGGGTTRSITRSSCSTTGWRSLAIMPGSMPHWGWPISSIEKPASISENIRSSRQRAAADVFSRFLAEGFALAGLPERAMDWLEIAVARGFINYPFLARHDPALKNLRSHPRFVQLLEIVRDRWEEFEV